MFKIKNETELKIEDHVQFVNIYFEKVEDADVYITTEKTDGLNVAFDGGSTLKIKRCNEITIYNHLNDDSSRSTIAVRWYDCNDTCQRVATYIPAPEKSDIEIDITKRDASRWEVWATVIV